MSKLTFYATLFCAALLFTVIAAPASAAPKPRLQAAERVAPQTPDAAKIAFLQSLVQGNGKQTPKSPRGPINTKMAPVACTGEGGMTTCCGPCGCCTWSGMGDGAHCASHC